MCGECAGCLWARERYAMSALRCFITSKAKLKKNFTQTPSHDTKKEISKRILQTNSLAQHWARDWRALAITQVQKRILEDVVSDWLGLALQMAQQATAPYGSSKRPAYSSGRSPFPTLPGLRCRSLGEGGGVPVGRGLSQWWSTVTPPAARRVRLRPPLLLQQPRRR